MSASNVMRQITAGFKQGHDLVWDHVDADSYFACAADDTLDVYVNGAKDFTVTANTLTALSGSTIKTNTIAETTAATGVTIDGTTIKDLQIRDATTGNNILLDSGAGDNLEIQIADVAVITVASSGPTLVGNSILDQQGLDSAILSFRSSDVTTGATTVTLGPDVTTSDYLSIGKASATTGGAHITSMAESTATEALHVECWGGAPATTDATTSLGAMNFFCGQHDGANADADMAANSNAAVWGEIDSAGARQTRMLLKADDGELHLGNTTLVALDSEDDVQLVRAMQVVATDGQGIVPTPYDGSIEKTYDYDKLYALGIVGPKDEKGHFLFKVQSRFALAEGAIWQLYNDLLDVVQALPESAKAALPERIQKKLAIA